jgi:hypothetical protein
LGARPAGPLARPHGIAPATRGEERPISKRQHLRDPNGYTHRCSEDTVGDDHKGPLNNQGKPAYLRKKINANEHKNMGRINPRAHGAPNSRPSHPRAELRFARGARGRTGRTPPRSRAGRPLGRGSASLEGRSPPRMRFRLTRGWAPPRAGFRLAWGLDAPSSESRLDRELNASSSEFLSRSRTSRARRLPTCSPDRGI